MHRDWTGLLAEQALSQDAAKDAVPGTEGERGREVEGGEPKRWYSLDEAMANVRRVTLQ